LFRRSPYRRYLINAIMHSSLTQRFLADCTGSSSPSCNTRSKWDGIHPVSWQQTSLIPRTGNSVAVSLGSSPVTNKASKYLSASTRNRSHKDVGPALPRHFHDGENGQIFSPESSLSIFHDKYRIEIV
jgi:hypothetical protein